MNSDGLGAERLLWQRWRTECEGRRGVAIPDYETLMLPVLRHVAGAGEAHIGEIAAAMADEFALTAEERAAQLPSGRGVTVVRSRAQWARTYMVQAGLLEAVRRGVVRATERGRALLAEDHARLDSRLLRRFPEFVAFQARSRNGAEDGDAADGHATAAPGGGAASASPVARRPAAPSADPASLAATPAERLASADREMRAVLASALLDRVRRLAPEAFERLMVDLLLAMGFGGSHAEAGRRLGQSGDGGVDGVIREDALGLDVVYIQAKRYAADRPVGPNAVREFAGALLSHGARKGVFATTSGFTRAAQDERERLASQQRIVLIDGDDLARLMIEHEVGVRVTQTVKVYRLDLDPYEDDDAA